MTNLFALCLIITSLSAAGFWSPSPQSPDHQPRDVIVKQGHRVVVVEYGDYGQGKPQHSTKVSFFSPQPNDPVLHDGLNIGTSERHRTRDVICDAYGKCKHKIASAVEKAAKVMGSSETEAMHAFDEAKETVSESFEKAKETVSEAKETVSEKASEAKETVSESLEKAKETVSEKASELKEGVEGGKERLVDGGVKLVKEYWFMFLVWVSRLKAATEGMSLLGFSMAMGMGMWNTFISSYVLASVLPRQQLGVVQSKIYPVYFRAMASSIGMSLIGHGLSHGKLRYELVVALLMVFVNSVYLEPQATKVMFERLKLEREEGKGTMEDISENPAAAAVDATAVQQVAKSRMAGLNKRLKNLNSYSSLLNLLTLVALALHLLYLAQRLTPPPPCH